MGWRDNHPGGRRPFGAPNLVTEPEKDGGSKTHGENRHGRQRLGTSSGSDHSLRAARDRDADYVDSGPGGRAICEAQDSQASQSAPARCLWPLTRLSLSVIPLWAFLDIVFGPCHETSVDHAWLNGGLRALDSSVAPRVFADLYSPLLAPAGWTGSS